MGGSRADRVPPTLEQAGSEPSLLLRPNEVALTLGVSRSKVFELLASQELPSVHIGRSTRVPRESLAKWIEAQIIWNPRAPGGLLSRLRSIH
jgi:excisionase family DNA binding protein